VSIFAAELNKRTSEEDCLVSRFFGTLAIADRSRALGAILSEVGVEIARSDLAKVRIEFWQSYFRATPAVLLEGESSLVFFEAPVSLADEKERLLEECEEGLKGNSHFTLALVTRHTAEPAEIAALRADLAARHKSARVVWTSWSRMYKRIHAIAAAGELDDVSRRLLGDLLRLLEEKGLRGFVGYGRDAYERAARASADLAAFARTTEVLMGEVNSVLEASGLHPFALGGAPQRVGEALRIPRSLLFPFREESWEGLEVARSHYYLDISLSEPAVRAGFRIDVSDAGRRALVIEKRAALGAALDARPDALFVLQAGAGVADALRTVRAGEGGLGFLEGRDGLRGALHADLVLPLADEDLTSENLASEIAERFVWLRDTVASAGLYPTPETGSERRFVVTNH
jgi:hypothetical protein